MGMQTTLSATLKLKKYQILPQKTVSCQPYALTRTGVRCMGRLSGLVENFIWCFKVKCAADNFVWAYADNFASDGAPQALGRELCLTDGALRGRRLCLGRCVLGRQLWLEPYMHGQSHIWLLLAENIVYPGDWDGPKTTFSWKEGYPRQHCCSSLYPAAGSASQAYPRSQSGVLVHIFGPSLLMMNSAVMPSFITKLFLTCSLFINLGLPRDQTRGNIKQCWRTFSVFSYLNKTLTFSIFQILFKGQYS